MNDKKISVIVPIYNVEQYLNKCIDSIINQTYKNLEIILVDDGSTDNSSLLADTYKNKDSRIIVIHQKNLGAASARNAGLDIATGDYISFIDSDDWIDCKMYEVMIKKCIETGAKIACCGRYDVFGDQFRCKSVCKHTTLVNSGTFLKKLLMCEQIDFAPCDKIYHKSLWNKIRFPNNLICEDIATIYKLAFENINIVLIYENLYFYNHRENSVTTNNKFNINKFDFEKISRQIVKDISNKKPSLSNEAIALRLSAINYTIIILSKMNFLKFLLFFRYYKSFKNEIKATRYLWQNKLSSVIGQTYCFNDYLNKTLRIKNNRFFRFIIKCFKCLLRR